MSVELSGYFINEQFHPDGCTCHVCDEIRLITSSSIDKTKGNFSGIYQDVGDVTASLVGGLEHPCACDRTSYESD
jgi:hypothetical protein